MGSPTYRDGMSLRVLVATAAVVTLAACGSSAPDAERPSGTSVASEPPAPSAPEVADDSGLVPRLESDGRPRRALLSIPSLGIRALPVEPYRGFTDDAPGTLIQDGGIAASPHGPRGGVGPGGIGNYQVTAHRTSSTRAFEFLPDLRRGQRVIVDVGRLRYVYEVRRTRITSFLSPRSLAEQRAAVPGRPGVAPERAYVTLSTCRTPEDRAEGNFFSDAFGNPENRVDKVGVLVAVRPRR